MLYYKLFSSFKIDRAINFVSKQVALEGYKYFSKSKNTQNKNIIPVYLIFKFSLYLPEKNLWLISMIPIVETAGERFIGKIFWTIFVSLVLIKFILEFHLKFHFYQFTNWKVVSRSLDSDVVNILPTNFLIHFVLFDFISSFLSTTLCDTNIINH